MQSIPRRDHCFVSNSSATSRNQQFTMSIKWCTGGSNKAGARTCGTCQFLNARMLIGHTGIQSVSATTQSRNFRSKILRRLTSLCTKARDFDTHCSYLISKYPLKTLHSKSFRNPSSIKSPSQSPLKIYTTHNVSFVLVIVSDARRTSLLMQWLYQGLQYRC